MSRSKQPLTIEPAILGFLRDGPLHAYELYRRLSAPDALGPVWPLKQSQLYALAGRLEEEGLLATALELRGTLPPRKLLQPTAAGHAAFTAWLHAPPEPGEDGQRAFLARLYFARRQGPATLRELLLRQRRARRAQLHALRAALDGLTPHSYPWLVAQWQARQAEAALGWLDAFAPPPAVDYPIAALADSPAPALAARFVDFVCGPAGQALLARFGFLPAGEPLAATSPAQPGGLRGSLAIYAASSLSAAFEAVGAAFREAHPEVELDFVFGGSHALAAELAAGAPADVYAPARLDALESVLAAGRVRGHAVCTFAHNQLAVVTPARGGAPLRSLGDLARPGLRLAIGSAATAIGRYTEDVFAAAAADGAFGAAGPAAVLHNVVCYAETVTGVLAKVAQGEVDAGIVFASDYHRAGGAVEVAVAPLG